MSLSSFCLNFCKCLYLILTWQNNQLFSKETKTPLAFSAMLTSFSTLLIIINEQTNILKRNLIILQCLCWQDQVWHLKFIQKHLHRCRLHRCGQCSFSWWCWLWDLDQRYNYICQICLRWDFYKYRWFDFYSKYVIMKC